MSGDVKFVRGGKAEVLRAYIALHKNKLIGEHWLWRAVIRIGQGEAEKDVMLDYGYFYARMPPHVHKGDKPTGFVARCPGCGKYVAALDYLMTPRSDSGRMMGEWLMSGHIVEPRFGSIWRERIQSCECKPIPATEIRTGFSGT